MKWIRISTSVSLLTGCAVVAFAAERRAPQPSFSTDSFRGVFFAEPSQAIRGTRPELGKPREAEAIAAAPGVKPTGTAGGDTAAKSGFTAVISPQTLEDEIKRVRLAFESGITTPAAFQSGGFQQARLHLNVLAALFAIITEHNGDVRWKKDAPAARDLLARSALNCKSGSGQVYNEVKQRKADLDDLVSGTGLANRQAAPENDWSTIADRVPMMIYLESLMEGPLKEGTQNADAVKANTDKLRRSSELVAAVGEILTREGLAGADDTDYTALCREMIAASGKLSQALEQGDAAAASAAVGTISQTCAKCHEAYR